MIKIETAEEKRIKEKLNLKKKKDISDENKSKVEIKQSPFFDKLLEVQQVESIKKELDEILLQLDEMGKKFSHNPTMENLKKYKSLVKSFMETVIEKMYKVTENYRYQYKLKRKKIYIIVETVNEKLEKLTKYILDKEKENINLMSTVDDIRGLLLDLYIKE